jgi:hypothetical protein
VQKQAREGQGCACAEEVQRLHRTSLNATVFCFFEPNFDTHFCAIFPPLQLTAQGATAVNNSAFA